MKKSFLGLLLPLILFLGCQKLSPGTQPEAEPNQNKLTDVYPHSVAFKTTTLHAVKFREDTKTCGACHAQEQSEAANWKACAKCHAGFPHTDNFKNQAHGGQYLGDATQCQKCHGNGMQQKPGSESTLCSSCHRYPHSADWSDPAQHGKTFNQDQGGHGPKVACVKCHGETSEFKKKYPDKFVSCFSCHESYPHTPEFAAGGHGGVFLKDKTACTGCHGKDFSGNPTTQAPACNNCHEFPHQWKRPSSHGEKFVQDIHGNGAAIGCQNCHAENSQFKQKFPDKFVSCARCHLQMPHPDLENFANGEHARLAREYSQGRCLTCHKDLTRNLPNHPNGCYDCHGDPKTSRLVIETEADGKQKAHWEPIP